MNTYRFHLKPERAHAPGLNAYYNRQPSTNNKQQTTAMPRSPFL